MPSAAPMQYPATVIPSMRSSGRSVRITRSLKVPGSLSSALQMTYLGAPSAARTSSHFFPVGNPAPPIPRRPLASSIPYSSRDPKKTMSATVSMK